MGRESSLPYHRQTEGEEEEARAQTASVHELAGPGRTSACQNPPGLLHPHCMSTSRFLFGVLRTQQQIQTIDVAGDGQ